MPVNILPFVFVASEMAPHILIHVSTIIADSEGRILFVREAKQSNYGLWNLPGGHVELGEHLTQAATREVLEETFLHVSLGRFIGVYSGISPDLQSIRFIFEAASYAGHAKSGDEILEIQWMSAEEIIQKSDSELVGPKFLRAIIRDWKAGRSSQIEEFSDEVESIVIVKEDR